MTRTYSVYLCIITALSLFAETVLYVGQVPMLVLYKTTVLLECLNGTFCISTCFWLYNSEIVDSILLSFCKSSLRWLLHHHSNFWLISFWGLSDSGGNSWFCSMQKLNPQYLTRFGFALYLFCFLVDCSSNSRKSHFSLFNLVAYSVGVTKGYLENFENWL